MANTTPVNTRLPNPDLEAVDALVAEGRAASRSGFIIDAVRHALAEIREAEIAELYRRSYADQPITDDEQATLDWAAEAGKRTLARESYE